MELNDETTVRGVLIIVNMATSGVAITLWRALKAERKDSRAFVDKIADAVVIMKTIIDERL